MKQHKYKSKNSNIKLSTTFLQRTKCKFCGDFSSFIYIVRNAHLEKEVVLHIKKFSFIKDNIKRLCDDYYLDFSPKYFVSNSFAHDVSYKGYNPRLHRLRNINKNKNYTQFVSCACGSTDWAFNYTSNETQPASYRKSSQVYPKRFT